MNNIVFPFVLLKNVILENKAKSIYIFIFILSFIFTDTFKNGVDNITIYKQYVYEDDLSGKTYVYIYRDIASGGVTYNLHQSIKPINMVNGNWVRESYSGYNVLMWVLFFLSGALLVFSFIQGIGDSDVSWNLEDCMRESLTEFIRCEEENGKFYYILFGRLIEVSDVLYHNRHGGILGSLGVDGFKSLKLYPKFETKKIKRQRLLDKLC